MNNRRTLGGAGAGGAGMNRNVGMNRPDRPQPSNPIGRPTASNTPGVANALRNAAGAGMGAAGFGGNKGRATFDNPNSPDYRPSASVGQAGIQNKMGPIGGKGSPGRNPEQRIERLQNRLENRREKIQDLRGQLRAQDPVAATPAQTDNMGGEAALKQQPATISTAQQMSPDQGSRFQPDQRQQMMNMAQMQGMYGQPMSGMYGPMGGYGGMPGGGFMGGMFGGGDMGYGGMGGQFGGFGPDMGYGGMGGYEPQQGMTQQAEPPVRNRPARRPGARPGARPGVKPTNPRGKAETRPARPGAKKNRAAGARAGVGAAPTKSRGAAVRGGKRRAEGGVIPRPAKTARPGMKGGGLARKGVGMALKGGGLARKGVGMALAKGGMVRGSGCAQRGRGKAK